MPHRRTIKKGSFGDHLDEVVKVLETERPKKTDTIKEKPEPRIEDASIHDRLFERAWKTGRAVSRTSDERSARH